MSNDIILFVDNHSGKKFIKYFIYLSNFLLFFPDENEKTTESKYTIFIYKILSS